MAGERPHDVPVSQNRRLLEASLARWDRIAEAWQELSTEQEIRLVAYAEKLAQEEDYAAN